MNFRIAIHEDWETEAIKIYGFAYNEDYKSFYLTIDGGYLKLNPKEEGEPAKECMLQLTRNIQKPFLEALTEGLKKAGFVAEVDNTQRITAEARNQERKEQIDWLRKQIEGQL
jgi:hypothetical protein